MDRQTEEKIRGIVSISKIYEIRKLCNEVIDEILTEGFSISDAVDYVRSIY